MTSNRNSMVDTFSNGALSNAKRQKLIELARFGRKSPVSGNEGVAVTSNPLVTQVAIDVLKDGGNAVDAIVAASVAQTVVEPSMTGLTGCWSLQYYHADTGKISYLNASTNAPLKLPITQQDWEDHATEYFRDGRCVTVPGFWAGVEEALRIHGSMPKKRLCAPAIDFARNGFEVDPFLWGCIFKSIDNIGISEQGREVFMPNGVVLNPGDKLYQKRAADLIERLVEEGNDYFYHGDFAQKFSKAVQDAGGWVTPDDFSVYQPRWDTPVHTTYRGYDFFSAPAPDYGGQMLAEILNMLEQMDLKKMGPAAQSEKTLWRMQQIIRLVGEANLHWHRHNNKPAISRILSKELAEKRIESLPDIGLPKVGRQALGSNHLTVTDAEGNVATVLHTSIGTWLNGLYVDGIHIASTGVTYGIGIPKGGERINLRCAPGMFLKDGRLVLVVGSPSASAIENVIQNTTNILDFGMSLEESVHQPRFGAEVGANGFSIEADMPRKTFDYLKSKQVPFHKVARWSWLHGSFEGMFFDERGMASACGDPRRNGQAFSVSRIRGAD